MLVTLVGIVTDGNLVHELNKLDASRVVIVMVTVIVIVIIIIVVVIVVLVSTSNSIILNSCSIAF